MNSFSLMIALLSLVAIYVVSAYFMPFLIRINKEYRSGMYDRDDDDGGIW